MSENIFKQVIEELHIKGYDGITEYEDNRGFSLKKFFSVSDKENVSLISFYITDKALQSSDTKKLMHIRVTYGKISDYGGVTMRDNAVSKFSEPVDLNSDDYFFDVNKKIIYLGDDVISPDKMVDDIYGLHIKPTRKFWGLWIRIKLIFWRVALRIIFNYVSKISHYFLFVMTGDKYSYEPFMEEETLNNRVINSKWRAEDIRPMNEKLEVGKKMDFFGYEAAYWPIIFYSLFHLIIYFVFEFNNFKPRLIVTILENNFLTLIYVIVSLWAVEIFIPMILKFVIRSGSRLSSNSLYKNISI